MNKLTSYKTLLLLGVLFLVLLYSLGFIASYACETSNQDLIFMLNSIDNVFKISYVFGIKVLGNYAPLVPCS